MIAATARTSGQSNSLTRTKLIRGVSAFAVGLSIGWLGWGMDERIWHLGVLIALPICWGLTTTRASGWALCLGYFMAGTRGLPVGAVAFFGENSPPWWGVAMWLSASLLLSAQFGLFWSRDLTRRAWGFLAALLVTSLSPLGIIGWVSPITVAGVLFPGGAWLGLLGCLVLFFFLASRNYRVWAFGLILAVGANFAAKDLERSAPSGWSAKDTYFSGMWSGGSNQASQLLASMERTQWLAGMIEQIGPGQTVVLPETLLGRWDGVIEGMLTGAEKSLKSKGSIVLVGAEVANGNGGYKNALIALGAREGEARHAVQSLPVPISMWKPWANDGADADFRGLGNTISVGHYTVGASICYEQLVLFSVLRLMLDAPDVIAAVSNVWWASDSNIPQIQHQSIAAFARLFNIPVLFASNT